MNKSFLNISIYQIRVFLITLGLVFLMVILQTLVPLFRNSRNALINPSAKQSLIQMIRPKLERIDNHFSLNKQTGFIAKADATGEYQQASSYAVIDLSNGEIIESKEISKKLPIASLTKIMTTVVALDLASPTDKFNVSQKAASQTPTKLGLPEGQKLTLEELLNGMLLTSANDAAQTIKEGVDQKYGGEVFIEAMNQKAKFLNLKNTHFSNPQGFDSSENFSSAEDLAILSQYALSNYPMFSQIVKKEYQFYPDNENHKQIDMYNWNGLLGVYPGAEGIKIGNTDEAKYTTVVTAQREGKKLLVIVLGADGVKQRDLWASQLLDLGFEKVANLPAVNITEAQLKEKYSSWKYFN